MVEKKDFYRKEQICCPFCGKEIMFVRGWGCPHFSVIVVGRLCATYSFSTRLPGYKHLFTPEECVNIRSLIADSIMQNFDKIVHSLAPVLLAEFARDVVGVSEACWRNNEFEALANRATEVNNPYRHWLPIAIQAVLGLDVEAKATELDNDC